MASTIKVNTLDTQTGTEVALAATKKITGANTQFKITGGSPNYHLQTDGSGGLTWVAPPTIGLEYASQWRLSADFTGAAAPIASNLIKIDTPLGFGQLGGDMTQSSGMFTFPATGYWSIRFHAIFAGDTVGTVNSVRIMTTTNNSTYATAAWTSVGLSAANHETGNTAEYIFAVTDTTQRKCRFDIYVTSSGCTIRGDAVENQTCMTFMKLGDIP